MLQGKITIIRETPFISGINQTEIHLFLRAALVAAGIITAGVAQAQTSYQFIDLGKRALQLASMI